MDGGWKSTATGLASYRSLRHHHNVRTLQDSPQPHGPPRTRRCTTPTGAWARSSPTPASTSSRSRPRSTPTRSRKPFDFLLKREWEWSPQGSGRLHRHRRSRWTGTPPRVGSPDLPVDAGAVRRHVGAGRRGRGGPRADARERVPPAAGARRGPDRHPHHGAAVHLPVQRQLGDEPDPRDVPRARVLLQPLPRQARSCARAAC